MLFGLTNAPITFQGALNHLLSKHLRKFVVIFFDILIYNESSANHVRHLIIVLNLLQSNSFYIWKSKCCFGLSKLPYQRHIIIVGKVHPDPEKVATMDSWLDPSTIWQARIFLGLTRYYHHFICQYTHISSPIMNLLKKRKFQWGIEAIRAFEKLKETLTTTLVLVYPNFDNPFVVQIDMCGVRVDAILLQEEHLFLQ